MLEKLSAQFVIKTYELYRISSVRKYGKKCIDEIEEVKSKIYETIMEDKLIDKNRQ